MQNHLFEAPSIPQQERPLRGYQASAIDAIRESIREGHKRIVLQLPTGGGKTKIAASIVQSALDKGRKPLFSCPAVSLIDQTVRAFHREGITDVGVMQASHPATNPFAAVQVASIHTLVRRAIPNVDFCIVDEVHESREDFDAILDSEAWAAKVVIGLSATPWKKGMGLRWKKLIVGSTIREMIEEGWLCPFVAYVPEHQLDRDRVKVVQGEFQESSAAAEMSQTTIVGDAVKEWKEKWGLGKTFMFCVNRKHAQAQMDAFNEAKVPCGYIDAYTPLPERSRIFRKLRQGEIAAIASVGCLVRGVDEDVRCILDLAPTRSESRHVQKIGRGLRTAEGKDKLVIIDSAGNSLSLGLVTDIYHDTLDTRKPGDRGEAYKDEYKPAKPRKCEKCRTLIPPGARVCPVCKERVALNHGVKVVDGRLVEIGSGPKVDIKERQEWYSGLLWIARKGNMKDGWAAYRYKSKFGVWPQGLKVRGKQPSEEVKEFVRQQRKEYMSARTTQSEEKTA
jgi:superfamily II DNA or RNA helicase